MILAGWILSALLIVFMVGASATPKLLGLDAAIAPLTVVGWDTRYLLLIAGIEIGCMVLFAIPRTTLLGTVLTTALLGAALAANLRVDNPLYSHTLFSLYLGIAFWVALWLREPRIRDLFPLG